jgi:hypothetical protein
VNILPTTLCLGLLLAGPATGALAATPPVGKTVVLLCSLKHSIPRDVHHAPPPPFTQHFKVNLEAKTVDGVKATVSPDKIGWEPLQIYLHPYATLTLPGWNYASSRWYNHMRDEITGTCVEQ